MRDDAIGMFWEDVQTTIRGAKVARPLAAIPDTGWRPPPDFPDLSRVAAIAVDLETWDPDLLKYGPGWARGVGHIVGVAIGVPGGGRWYFPIRHEVQPEFNLDPQKVLAWLKDTLANPAQAKIGANIQYDVGWLQHEGVTVKGDLIDVQFAEALLDESAQVALEVLGQKYLGEGKQTNLLYQWCADSYGGKPNSDQRQHIHKAPPVLVGPYAEGDVDLPLRLAPILYHRLVAEDLFDVFMMECHLIPLMIAMRFAGVTVDLKRAEELSGELTKRQEIAQAKLDDMAGVKLNIGSGGELAKVFDRLGIPYPKTPKGAPSFRKKFLEDLDHPIGEGIREVRRLDKLNGTFIQSYILGSSINGKLYGQFHLLRGEDNGTRSGRLSSSTPNLQNIPARDKELAKLIRGMFIPDYGHHQWRDFDYSQIEYRFLIHFAVGDGADEARRSFNEKPDTDYHDMTMDLVAPVAGWDVSTPELRALNRRPIKNINFGLIFGMGIEKLAGDLGMSKAEGKKLFDHYHKAIPFAKATMDFLSKEAGLTGFITTVLGRKSRFDLWQPSGRRNGKNEAPAYRYDDALDIYGSNIERAYLHKALNRRLQGSAADLMKKAMLRCWEDGVFSYIGVPRLTVHDSLGFSDPGGVDDGFKEMHRIMENALAISIPIRADQTVGPNWGEAK